MNSNLPKTQILQDPFLNALRKHKVPVAIYLTNGIKLQGTVHSFDQYVVLLKNNTKQMVFKHAIATIVPSRNVIWHEGLENSGNVSEQPMEEEPMPIEDY